MLGDLLAYLAANAAEQDWMDSALCAQADPDAWFPEPGQRNDVPKAICSRCPVQQECLDHAIENDEMGIWGGMTEAERGRQEQAAA
jgi:WhiB family redox-sensing transcriptional regulator